MPRGNNLLTEYLNHIFDLSNLFLSSRDAFANLSTFAPTANARCSQATNQRRRLMMAIEVKGAQTRAVSLTLGILFYAVARLRADLRDNRSVFTSRITLAAHKV